MGCLSNVRQVALSFKMHLSDTSDRMDEPAIAEYFAYRMGLDSEGWICPSAPVRLNRPKNVPWWVGTATSACRVERWDTQLGIFPTLANGPINPTNRAGSYSFNGWLASVADPGYSFESEAAIPQPSLTPIVVDGVLPWTWPGATDPPPESLLYGEKIYGGAVLGHVGWMCLVALPRHGSRPHPIPDSFVPSHQIPGAVNVSFFDGHAELTRPDSLWQLSWHRNYQPPAKRPGLR